MIYPTVNKLSLLALALCLLLSACAGRTLDDPALLQRSLAAVESQGLVPLEWGAKPARVNASVRPESTAIFSLLGGDMALMGVYRNYDAGDTRYALAMPQGTRMGSAVRGADGRLEFQSMTPLAVMSDLVRASFFAIDEFFASAPDVRAKESWHLQDGDVHGGIKRGQAVLVRHRALGWGSYARYLYDLSGKPLVFYQVSGQKVDWKLSFKPEAERVTYVFRDYRYTWLINVEILEVSP